MNAQAFEVYLLCTGALVLNFGFLVLMTGLGRTKSKTFTIPEDATTFKGKVAESEAPAVLRAQAAHRNALENIPLFLILGLLYVMTGATREGALAYFVTFTVARWLHSILYLRGIQPWRTATFTVGFLAMFGLAVQLVITALS